MNIADGMRHGGASKHRRGHRRRHGALRQGRSVAPNVTLASRLPDGVRGRPSTTVSADFTKAGTTTATPRGVLLTYDVRQTRDGRLQVLVSWVWSAASTTRKKVSSSETLDFTIHWARQTCNLDDRLPHCDDPDAYYSNTVWSRGYKVRR